VIAGYAGEMLNRHSYLTINGEGPVFAVIGLGHLGDQRFVDTSPVARLVRDTIVIERDANNRPLVDALLVAGVPRDQIILAYAGGAA
jgi:hypothetical protein